MNGEELGVRRPAHIYFLICEKYSNEDLFYAVIEHMMGLLQTQQKRPSLPQSESYMWWPQDSRDEKHSLIQQVFWVSWVAVRLPLTPLLQQ